ncbi:MAG: alpha/beta hydrolase [Opitutaceae bacterium]|nr:alpha/beta hydrolase [Opitutaceae bacterium]
MSTPRFLKLFAILSLTAASLCLADATAGATDGITHERDIIYGRKYGMALVLDVLRPANADGAGIIVVMSGGWKCHDGPVDPDWYSQYLKQGYTIFAVRHGSQPRFVLPEIIGDVHRAVRFIRHNAARWPVDPGRLGITGGSAGGHLSLIIGTQGGPGDPDAADPVDRESSAVRAVACFYPPTDFLNYGAEGVSGMGTGPLAWCYPAFGPRADMPGSSRQYGREISPIYSVSARTPPVFIIHGDRDTTVPLQQSETFIKRLTGAGVPARLYVKAGAGHTWRDMESKIADGRMVTDWFNQYLRDQP